MRIKLFHLASQLPVVLLVSVSMMFGFGAACSSEETPTLFIAGIPDQDQQLLQARFEGLANYLRTKTLLDVQYVPTTSYAAVVTAFRHGDIHLVWYGGLTGVQARLAVPSAQAVAQRPMDEQFQTVFVSAPDSGITSLQDLEGKTFTFGSANSTSGRLMPLHFMSEAGLQMPNDIKQVNFSGSHDRTWKLVEAGAFDAGALNANVWKARVKSGAVNPLKVAVFWTTPTYHDYHWVIQGDLDTEFGDGVTDRLREALMTIDQANGGHEKMIMDAFHAPHFIATKNSNYYAIEKIGRDLGLIR